ncbi:hypothetical protein [Paraburkholderia sp. BR10882]|uniref:hypothetical protein n=1 Tax=unclassified Paraburkholderia TaxID=2615204 RepID=UPI0034CDA392
MYEHHTLLSIPVDLAFFWLWFAVYQWLVPTSGARRIAGIAGMAAVFAGYLELSASFFARWDASRYFDAWAMPLTLFEKIGALAVAAAIALLVVVNRGTNRAAVAAS